MLGFIIGTNENARREKLYSAIRDWGKSALLIVPEQFSFESEKLLDEFLGAEAAQKTEVLSFSRLCNNIFRRFGGIAGEHIDDTSRLLIMGAALTQCADELRYYKKNVRGAAFIQKLIEADSELKNAAVGISVLSEFFAEEDSAFSEKMGDLSLVLELYNAMLEKNYTDPLCDLVKAAELLSENDFFGETAVFIDNFAGFTGSEKKMLRRIIDQSPLVTVSLCCDGIFDQSGGTGLFSQIQKTASGLIHIAKDCGTKITVPVLAEAENDERPAAVAGIENGFFRRAEPADNSDKAVRLISAADPYDEAAFVACMARELAEKGFRWKDMTVIARDFSDYERPILEAFEKAGIPLYMDRREALSAHPLSAFVTASLAACRSGFDTTEVLRILKTGILPLENGEIAEFENYCFVWEIRGKMFLSDFTGNPKGFKEEAEGDFEPLERINGVRRALFIPLSKLRERIKSSDGKEFAGALFDYLTECKVTEGLRRLYFEYTAEGKLAEAEDLDTLWSYTVSSLDKFRAALAGITLPAAEMTRLFETAAGYAKIGVLPHSLDCVYCAAADRARPSGIKAAFIVGVCEGDFPAPPKSGSLITESDRRLISKMGIELSENSEEALLSERIFAYNAFCCASEKVFVSFPHFGADSGEKEPSALITRLKEAVAPLPEESTADFQESFRLCSESLAFDRLASFGRESSPASEALKKYFSEKPEWSARAQKLGVPAAAYSFVLKDERSAGALFGTSLRTSPSGIEEYEKCPFSYFADKGLKLAELKKAQLSPLSAGNIIHRVLQDVVSEKGAAALSEMSDGELRAEIEKSMSEYLETVMGSAENKSGRFLYLYKRIGSFLLRLLRRLGEEFSVSEFEPYGFEIPLDDEGEIPCYKLETAEGRKITVTGRIDRLDIMEKNGKRYVRVVDYKSGTKNLELRDIYCGLNLQMLVYLFSIWKGGKGGLSSAVPAGVLYMPAADKVQSLERHSPPEKIRENELATFRMNGLLLEDEAVLSSMEPALAGIYIPAKRDKNGEVTGSLVNLDEMGKIERHIDKLLGEMFDGLSGGKISAVPFINEPQHPVCAYCAYKPVCRRAPDDPYREFGSIKKDEFFKLIKGDEEA